MYQEINMEYSCPHCPKKYKSNRDLKRHVQDKHDEVVGNESEKDNKQNNVVSKSKTFNKVRKINKSGNNKKNTLTTLRKNRRNQCLL